MIWREKIEREAAAGARFGCLYVSGARIVAVLEREQGLEAIPSEPIDGPVPSLIDIYPAAEWDEREAHDLYGVEFEGHDPLKPLVHHPEEPRTWMTPVKGRDVHQVAVGPIHAGVIESGHFRFHLVGEQILALDLRLFYKHRGIEKLVEGADAAGSMRHLGRVCASSNVAIQIALARCWELNLGLEPDAGLRRVRTVLIELERLYNHLNDIGAICAGVGYSPGAMAFASLKERVQRLNTELAGHRFLFDSIEVGGSSLVADDETRAKMRVEIEQIAIEAAGFWREILFSISIQERMRGTGSLSREVAERLGLVGPAARASGLEVDRRTRPMTGLAYGSDFRPARLEVPGGDVAARTEIRAVEIEQICGLLVELLSGPIEPCRAERVDGSAGRQMGAAGDPVLASVEGPRGEIIVALEVDEGRVRRLHLRAASFRNWPALKEAVIGDILPDFPLINKSFELSYAAVDR